MRLVSRIPADRGVVAAVRVLIVYDGTDTTPAIDVTDVQLQPGEPTGVVPHPSDIVTRPGATTYRNGIVTRSTDEVIFMANTDLATPTRVEVTPAGPGTVRVGSYRFGAISGPAYADAETQTASHGWGRPPVLTERSDGRARVETEQPVHLTLGWAERY